MQRGLTGLFLLLILLTYLFLGYRYATDTPDWQVPDEPAHYNYIRQIVEDHRLPVITAGDWDDDYLNLLRNTGFNPAHTGEIERIEYEDHQPPLYYFLAAPVYALTEGDLTSLRLFSVLLGAGVVLGIFAVVNRLFPSQPWLALCAAALTAFLPQNVSIISGVNNDVLAQLMVALTFLLMIHYFERPHWQAAAWMGLAVGFAFLTKSTVYFLAGIGLGAIVLAAWRERWSRQVTIQQVAAFLIPALLLGAVWWLRSVDVYGGTDFLGLQRHDEVAAAQLKTQDYIYGQLNGDLRQYWRNFAYTTFHSFWGQFGWMGVPMPIRIYRLLLLISAGLLLSAGLYLWFSRRNLTTIQQQVLSLLTLQLVLVFAAYFLYNRQFVQFQGRYLYPALLPFGLIAAMGLASGLMPFEKRWPGLRWLPVVAMFGLAFLAWYALENYLIPSLPNWD